MVLKSFRSPIFVILILFFLLQSCEKKPVNTPSQKSNLAEIDRLIDLGDHYYENVNYDSAYYYHNKAKSLCDVKTDNTRIIYSLSRMSEIQQNQGDFSGSETTTIEAIPFLAGLKKMISGFHTDAVHILITNIDSIDWKALETNKKIIVYRVLQEPLVNMKKFR
jgi:hypothetical protein